MTDDKHQKPGEPDAVEEEPGRERTAEAEDPGSAGPENVAQEDAAQARVDDPAEAAALAASAAAASAAEATAALEQERGKRSGGSSGVAWLALLLVLGLGGAAGWFYLQLQQREAALVDRMAYLEDSTGELEQRLESRGSDRSELRALTEEWDGRLSSMAAQLDDMAALEARVEALAAREPGTAQAASMPVAEGPDIDEIAGEVTTRMRASLAQIRSEAEQQTQEIERLAARLEARDQEPKVNINRDAWLLAEVGYLLRLANQRMIMAGDTVAAAALLASADSILRDLDDISLMDARAAVTADLAAVRAVPSIDVEGTYLRLAALIGQVEKLVIFELPGAGEEAEPAPAENWQERLSRGYQEAWRKLSSYIVVRRRDTPMEALMDPHWERMVRQNMRMLLEQAQVALLSGNQVLFQESLERAGYWISEFFATDESTARALVAELDDIRSQTIAVELPDITGSVRAFDAVMERRVSDRGEG